MYLPYYVLIIIVLLALLIKDFVVAGAACSLALIMAFGAKPSLSYIQQYSFSVGIFFLMLFLLMPIATGKVTSESVMKLVTSPVGIGSIVAGFLVSYIGGRGVGILPANPTILLGVLFGTLIAVLFMKGLPAGLIIAAGVMALFLSK